MDGSARYGWWPPVAVAVLLVLVGAAATVASPQLTRIPVPAATGAPPTGPTAPARPQELTEAERPARPVLPGGALPAVLAVLLAVVVAGLLVLLALITRFRLRARPGRLPAPDRAPARSSAEQVVAAVDAGLSDLSDTDSDPRRAVIACWVRLEQVAAAAGIRRQAADTPADLVTRLLAGQFAVDPAVLGAFADIYRVARYAPHTVDEQMRVAARSALERVRDQLSTEVPR